MSGRWPLEALRGLREREEEGARAALAAACADERTAAAERVARADAVAGWRAARARAERDPGGSPLRVDALAARDRRCAALRRRELDAGAVLAEAERRVEAAKADVTRARAALYTARRALEVLERHRAAWDGARRRERERAAEAAQDDRAQAPCGREGDA
ncbi:YscO family type III secretion system apparatus protein [Anaeromyxobacter oryzisoli]|uniref:YscO family type III secretion system apparatus protein n=1 Tax=Anaeromyxobacter oryzisoli TaxID=2925408 RepID=UPI001F581D4C|nr:YscO family type III secretion system apparatus protein [Anaeromyxobacter sp. SG63]